MSATPTESVASDEPVRRRWRPSAPTGWNLVALAVAVAFLAGVVGWRIAQPAHPSSASADVGFLYDMIEHHQQAITMAAIELANGSSTDVRTFAEEIHRVQSYEIGLMERLLIEQGRTRYDAPRYAMEWMGHQGMKRDAMPGLASTNEMASLQRARGADADAAFLALMVDHHAGGADMARAAASKADNDAVRELAARMAKVQQQEIGELLGAAERADLTVPPPGVTWDVYR